MKMDAVYFSWMMIYRLHRSVVAWNQLTSNIDLIVDRRIDSVFLGAGFPADTSPVDSQEAAMVGAKGAQAAADPEASSGRPIFCPAFAGHFSFVFSFSFISLFPARFRLLRCLGQDGLLQEDKTRK